MHLVDNVPHVTQEINRLCSFSPKDVFCVYNGITDRFLARRDRNDIS